MHRPGFVSRGPWGPRGPIWGPRGPIVSPTLGDGDAGLAVARGADAGSVSRPGYSRARICPRFATALYPSDVASRESLVDLNFRPDSGAGLGFGRRPDPGFVARQIFLRARAPLILQAPIPLALIASLGVALPRR